MILLLYEQARVRVVCVRVFFFSGFRAARNKHMVCTISYKVPLRDVVDLKSRGCRELKRGNTGVPIRCACMSLLVHYVRFAGVVPTLLLLLLHRCCTARVLYWFKGSAGWNRPGCAQDGACAHVIRTHTRIHKESSFAAVVKRRPLKCGCSSLVPGTMHGCHNVKSLAFGVIQVHSSRQRRQPKRKTKR